MNSKIFTIWPFIGQSLPTSLLHKRVPFVVVHMTGVQVIRTTTCLCSAVGSPFSYLMVICLLPLPPLFFLFYYPCLGNPGTHLNPMLNVTSSKKSFLLKGEDEFSVSGVRACGSRISGFNNYYLNSSLSLTLQRTQVHQEVEHTLYFYTPSLT